MLKRTDGLRSDIWGDLRTMGIQRKQALVTPCRLQHPCPSVTSLIENSPVRHLPCFSPLQEPLIQTLPTLTSKDSQHLFQVRGSKQTSELGGESLGLPQGPELTPSEGTPYESFRVLSPHPSDPLMN